MDVKVVFALPHSQQQVALNVMPDCTVIQAVSLACQQGLDLSELGCDLSQAAVGIFGERVAHEHVLRSGDRVEIYRVLQQDPMEWRRKRAASEVTSLPSRRK